MTPQQQRRKDLEDLLAWSREAGTDERSLILLLKEVAISCVDEGIQSERINMKAEDGGVSTLTERFPAIAVSAILAIHKIQTDSQKELDRAPAPDTIINVHVERRRLEDTL